MRARRTFVALAATVALAVAPAASASPYNEVCGDGTLLGCTRHCITYHGGVGNLHNCLWGHYLV